MKYRTLKIPGHPRSGSHWINRVMDMNFFDGSDYVRHYGGHPWGNEQRALKFLSQPHQAVLYTFRNIDDTIDSVYRMRHRFGLDEDDRERFRNTPMRELYNPRVEVDAERDLISMREDIKQVDRLLATRTETIEEYIINHKRSWRVHLDKPNFMMVSYDNLVRDFNGTMLEVAEFLGSTKTTFEDEQRRVGWREKADNNWKKP